MGTQAHQGTKDHDWFQVLNVSVRVQTFAEALELNNCTVAETPLEGMLGLAFPEAAASPALPSPITSCASASGTETSSPSACVNGTDMGSVDTGIPVRKTGTETKSQPRRKFRQSEVIAWEIELPKSLGTRFIGKQGQFIKTLRRKSGAKVSVSTLPHVPDSKVCHIEGLPHQVEMVLSLIGRRFERLCLPSIYPLYPPAPETLPLVLESPWLLLPQGVAVAVAVVNQVDAGHMFVQQPTHPTFCALPSLHQQMFACYSQQDTPTLFTPVEVGTICVAPGQDGTWLRAQVMGYCQKRREVELRYVDYGGYERVKTDTLRQIRSDFLSLPFQGLEVLLDNVAPLAGEGGFSPEADAAVSEMTRGAALVAQVTSYDLATGLPLIQLWSWMRDEVVSVNAMLVERGFAQWLGY
ncbi:A-kinase anchor protein 1, mitochondrial-like [Colius striatus]|uniref:A-kinase anchor protein 1, mitochondrial-like n=1 Tax=Colius striatus TaxID=57412 RepID=UPI002B1E1200|nr:A-kinase anchor protein 1, mitochondrial-like [Colius striatus]